MYFLQEIKKVDNKIIKLNDTSITFMTGNTFTFQDNSIYFNNIKICEYVKDLKFDVEDVNSKKIIIVFITIGENLEYTKTTKFVMN